MASLALVYVFQLVTFIKASASDVVVATGDGTAGETVAATGTVADSATGVESAESTPELLTTDTKPAVSISVASTGELATADLTTQGLPVKAHGDSGGDNQASEETSHF